MGFIRSCHISSAVTLRACDGATQHDAFTEVEKKKSQLSIHTPSVRTLLPTVMQMKHPPVRNHAGPALLGIRSRSCRCGAMFGQSRAQIGRADGKWPGSASPSEVLIKGNASQRSRVGMIAHVINQPTPCSLCVCARL